MATTLNVRRSARVPEYLNDITAYMEEHFNKKVTLAAAEEPQDLRTFEEKHAATLKDAVYHGWGIYEQADTGHIWRVEKNADGEAVLVRDDELSGLADIVREAMQQGGGAANVAV